MSLDEQQKPEQNEDMPVLSRDELMARVRDAQFQGIDRTKMAFDGQGEQKQSLLPKAGRAEGVQGARKFGGIDEFNGDHGKKAEMKTEVQEKQKPQTPDHHQHKIGSGADSAFPLQAGYDSAQNKMIIKGCMYEMAGLYTELLDFEGTGKFAYLRVNYLEDFGAPYFDSVELMVAATALDANEMNLTNDKVLATNILIASAIVNEDGSVIFNQYRSGNVTFYHQVVNGYICLYPFFDGGTR
jgi:hypothetical protein